MFVVFLRTLRSSLLSAKKANEISCVDDAYNGF